MDHRWGLHDGIVDGALRSEFRQLAWLTTRQSWRKSPILPNGILDVPGTIPELALDEPNRRPLILIQERKFGDAIPLLKKRIAENPRDYVGWWLLGDCCHAIQDFENAQQSYTVCIALQPKTAIAYFNRGMARFSTSHFEWAADDYEQACFLAPTWYWSRLNRALSLQRLGRLSEAIEELDRAIKKGYKTVSVYRLRGELQAALGDADGAKLDFSNALHCEPTTDQHSVENLLFYHPVVWWLSSRVRQEREHCCDDIAAQFCGSRVKIARALATLAELNARAPALLPAATGGSVVQRIRRLLQADAKPERMSCVGIGIL